MNEGHSPPLTASAIICTRDRLRPLLDCLASLAGQSFPLAQLIVVDSSEPPVREAAEFAAAFSARRFPSAELLYLHTAPGLTRQRNVGVAHARADVIFFFDDDVVLAPDYIQWLMADFGAHPEYGGGMGAIAGIAAGPRRASEYLRRLFLLSHCGAKGRLLPSGLPVHPHGQHEFMTVEVLSGAAMAYRAAVLREFAFDEAVGGYGYMEDVDFSYRVSRRYKLFYDPRAVAEHRNVPLAREKVAANRRMFLVNHHYFFFKNVYPACRGCLLAYIWSVIGLFSMALLGGHGQALRGYAQGLGQVLANRLRGRPVLWRKGEEG